MKFNPCPRIWKGGRGGTGKTYSTDRNHNLSPRTQELEARPKYDALPVDHHSLVGDVWHVRDYIPTSLENDTDCALGYR